MADGEAIGGGPPVRQFEGTGGLAFYALAIAIALFHLWANTTGTLASNWVSAIHFGLFGLMAALAFPLLRSRDGARRRGLLVLDLALGLAALATGIYLIAAEQALYDRGVELTSVDIAAGTTAIVLSLELVRRTTGWVIPILVILALSYVLVWGRWLDGAFFFPGLGFDTLIYRAYFSSDGMFGPIAIISWSYVFMFILFGAFLVQSGAGDFIVALARAVAGRFVGGPGLVAVIGSGLMGSITGSAVANTVSTGVITIPLMKKAGFPARFAGAVEASASTGGQLMPPVMGAAAFIMASYTQVPYGTIVAVSILPALLYFLSIGFHVRLAALKHGIRPDRLEQPADVPGLGATLRSGWHFLVPLGTLVGLLIAGFTPTFAASVGIAAVIAGSWLSPQRMGLRAIGDAAVAGVRMMTPTALLLIAIGLVVNALTTTGVGTTFSLLIGEWSGGSLLLMILFVGLASLVLGMGLPVTASYIVLATLTAPAMADLMAQSALVQAIAAGEVSEMARAVFLLADPQAATALGSPMTLAEAQALVEKVPADMLGQILQSSLDPALLTSLLLAAHLIVFWLSQDSNVTPPVCLTAYAASAIAGAKPLATGLSAWRIAKALYIVPLLFAYTGLITDGWDARLVVFLTAALGLYAAAAAFEGFLEARTGLLERAGLGAASVLLLWPAENLLGAAAGAALLLGLWVVSRRKSGLSAS